MHGVELLKQERLALLKPQKRCKRVHVSISYQVLLMPSTVVVVANDEKILSFATGQKNAWIASFKPNKFVGQTETYCKG